MDDATSEHMSEFKNQDDVTCVVQLEVCLNMSYAHCILIVKVIHFLVYESDSHQKHLSITGNIT